MNYCGFDLGKKSSHYCIMDGAQKVLVEKRVPTNEPALRMVLKSYTGRPSTSIASARLFGFRVALPQSRQPGLAPGGADVGTWAQ